MPACALCGTPAPPPYRAPMPEQAPDLDMRPGEPARSTLPRWVTQCRSCGACAPDLAGLPDSAASVGSAAYRKLGSPFTRWAALAAGTAAEPEALLQAAWEADDRGAVTEAAELRRRAAALWPEPGDAEQALRLVDILRRAGEFGAAAARLAELGTGLDEISQRIAAFQQARIAARDAGRYMMSSALPPPTTRPHVAKPASPPPARGFWGRLFGG